MSNLRPIYSASRVLGNATDNVLKKMPETFPQQFLSAFKNSAFRFFNAFNKSTAELRLPCEIFIDYGQDRFSHYIGTAKTSQIFRQFGDFKDM